ncbi:hypothetical protein HPB51_012060 [Rhipicephalus microplus]|uniref:Uncharacterized protein n=1 Tax=Rhipicephalus microplus TaxID=6941 RepID=A0A9J6F2G0_RHIMP|nr:hypothetical protein HPB51_012060 [Rhipicephalus microplus]
MTRSTYTELITLAGLQVPRYVYYYHDEYPCYIHRLRKQVCAICLAFGHRADISPTPTKCRCHACGVETPAPTECFHCKGDHPATHPKCPAREQKPLNKHYVKKALEANALAPPPTSPPKGHRPRSRTRRSQSKNRGKSQDMALESLNNTPGTASKTSTTTLGLIPQKNRAASAERPESPPAKKPAPAGQTPPAKVSVRLGREVPLAKSDEPRATGVDGRKRLRGSPSDVPERIYLPAPDAARENLSGDSARSATFNIRYRVRELNVTPLS